MKPTVKILLLLFLVVCFAGCDECNEPTTFEEDEAELAVAFEHIQSIATSVPCTDPAEWAITPYGAKPCGGPWGFIAYPTTAIDVNEFLGLIENYRQENVAFNERWGLGSDCSVPSQPTGVACENGSAILIY